MIRFYPRDVAMFRNEHFDFSVRGDITLICRTVTDYKDFHDREELIQFLKQCGVRLDDGQYPLTFTLEYNDFWHTHMYIVHQWTLLGWVKEFHL